MATVSLMETSTQIRDADLELLLAESDREQPFLVAPRRPERQEPREELEVDDEHEVGDTLERFLRACGVPLGDVPGVLREAGEAARREGSVTVRVRADGFRPGVDVVTGNFVRLPERRRAARIG